MPLRLNGSTSGYSEIDAPAIAGNNTLVLPTANGAANQLLKNGSTPGVLEYASMTLDSSGNLNSVASINGGPLAGFRNLVTNGDFQIWQRGVTFTNANGYTADRWAVGGTGTLCNVGQGSHPSGLSERVALNFTGVAGNTRSFALQKIESQNMANLYPAPYAATQVTLSVNIYSTSARTIDLIADYANTADNFSAVTNITSHSVSVGANTFNRYSHTFTLPAEAARGMQIVLNAQTGITSGTVAFSMVQLEPGAVATPFERRPIGTELALCQRYYQKNNGNPSRALFQGYCVNGQGYPARTPFHQQMRGTPIINLTHADSLGFPGTVGSTSADASAFVESRIANSTQNSGYYISDWTASAEL